jgi:hypothetical protein
MRCLLQYKLDGTSFIIQGNDTGSPAVSVKGAIWQI